LLFDAPKPVQHRVPVDAKCRCGPLERASTGVVRFQRRHEFASVRLQATHGTLVQGAQIGVVREFQQETRDPRLAVTDDLSWPKQAMTNG
jgi:hypothetical protein